jgi:hypothetical protein
MGTGTSINNAAQPAVAAGGAVNHLPVSPVQNAAFTPCRNGTINNEILSVSIDDLTIWGRGKIVNYRALEREILIAAAWTKIGAVTPALLILAGVLGASSILNSVLIASSVAALVVARELRNIAALVNVFGREIEAKIKIETQSAKEISKRIEQFNLYSAALSEVATACLREDYSHETLKRAFSAFQYLAAPAWLNSRWQEAIAVLNNELCAAASKDPEIHDRKRIGSDLANLGEYLSQEMLRQQGAALGQLALAYQTILYVKNPNEWTLKKLWQELKRRRLSGGNYKPEHFLRKRV